MGDPFQERPIPRSILFAGTSLVVFAILAVALARLTDVGITSTPTANPVASVEIVFDPRPDGSVIIREATSGAVLATRTSGQRSFLLGMLRGIEHERSRFQVPEDTPYVLTRWSDGRFTMTDDSTGLMLESRAFGADNANELKTIYEAALEAR
ncbi:photosynthetic complex assembly protein PuhC [Roseospirillum parvum]|uniref:Putative photosynthetic complex assembly protein n=1 Tax=Roseospirillum parvum TaxID=83401 RepID=A0A1G7WFC9_9PROT|nr:photosynthetic complex assembly protein PuhC [Roseospirillum parvum]SDG70717.1 putative photosynthetic complex assembly protein [Roseospirillum parvum]